MTPGWLHLVLTRERADASLWPLRIAGELFEIGDDDLRMSVDEAIELLAAEPDFPSHEVIPAYERTEGWIAGLKLTALARRSGDDGRSAIREFLYEEVIARQAPDIQKFLMETSCLEDLTLRFAST
jgi:LuxR family maltose regulon positive regulatory protein